MIAGVLVSLILVVLFCPDNGSVHVIRAAALGTIAMGFGGSMTYGQTVVDPRHTAGRKLGFPSLGCLASPSKEGGGLGSLDFFSI